MCLCPSFTPLLLRSREVMTEWAFLLSYFVHFAITLLNTIFRPAMIACRAQSSWVAFQNIFSIISPNAGCFLFTIINYFFIIKSQRSITTCIIVSLWFAMGRDHAMRQLNSSVLVAAPAASLHEQLINRFNSIN